MFRQKLFNIILYTFVSSFLLFKKVLKFQVAIMDSNGVNWNNYHEILFYFVPYCGAYCCGFDYETIKKRNITPWTCIPTK